MRACDVCVWCVCVLMCFRHSVNQFLLLCVFPSILMVGLVNNLLSLDSPMLFV